MKTNVILLALMAVGILASGACCGAEEDSAEKTPATKVSKADALSPVAKAIKKLSCFNGKPNVQAEYYIYLQLASWCPPCRAEMPEIASLYEQMKENGVEILLVSADSSKKMAKKYLKEFDADFPATMPKKDGGVDLPGFKDSPTIPHATIVTKDGEIVRDGHGSIVLNYRSEIDRYEKEHPSPSAAGSKSDSAKEDSSKNAGD